MRIVVNTFAYFHSIELIEMISSLDPGLHQMQVFIHLHSEKPEVVAACKALATRSDVQLFAWGMNRGLAKSFNDTLIKAFSEGASVVINAHDDTIWGPGDLRILAEYAVRHQECYAVQAMGQHSARGREGLHHAACAFNRSLFERVGVYDEDFVPAYYEDCDIDVRARLAGLEFGTCVDTDVWHFGSATLAHDEELRARHDPMFLANQAYYVRKWGGLNEQELFKWPFNEPRFGLRIDPADRNNPYPGYGRTDLS